MPKAPAGSLYASLKGARGVLRTPLGLLMGGAALVLALMISLLAFISIERSEAAMGRLLAEKGSSFIIAFESILRSGMRSEAGVRLQVLLEEMASSPGIIFIAVTMPDGTIVAHSDRSRLGEILRRLAGPDVPAALRSLLDAAPERADGVRSAYARLGLAVRRQ